MNRFERMNNTVREWEPSRQTRFIGPRLRQFSSPMRLTTRSRKDSSDSLSGSVCSHTISRCTSPTNKRFFQHSSSESFYHQNGLFTVPCEYKLPMGDVQYNAYYVSGGVLFAPEGFNQEAAKGPRKLVHIQAAGSESETEARRVRFERGGGGGGNMRPECHPRRNKLPLHPMPNRHHSGSSSRRFMRFNYPRSGGRREFGKRDVSPDRVSSRSRSPSPTNMFQKRDSSPERMSRSRSPSPTNIARPIQWEADNSTGPQQPCWEAMPPNQQGAKWEMPQKAPGLQPQWENFCKQEGQSTFWEMSKSNGLNWETESKKSRKSEWDSDSLKSHGSPWEKDNPKARTPYKSSSPHSIHSHHGHRHRHHHGKHRHNHKWKEENRGEWNPVQGKQQQQQQQQPAFPYSMLYYPKPSHEGWLSPVNNGMDPGNGNPTHEGWLIPVRERLGNDSPTHVGWISPVHGPVRPFTTTPTHEGWITPVRSPFGLQSTLHEGRVSPVHQPMCPLSSATGSTNGRVQYTTTGHGSLQAVQSSSPRPEEKTSSVVQQICTRKQEEAQVHFMRTVLQPAANFRESSPSKPVVEKILPDPSSGQVYYYQSTVPPFPPRRRMPSDSTMPTLFEN